MKRVFIFGYYGFHNIGDEAILEAIVDEFREILPGIELTALSYNASETANRYQVKAVSRNRFIDVVKSIGQSDLVMSGGGSILQDVTSSRSLMYYLGIILLAKLLGKKVAFYGNGFGPIQRKTNRWLARLIINHVDLITVRDGESQQLMVEMGITKPIHVTADAAFTLNTNPDAVNREEAVKKERKVAISVRKWKNMQQYVPLLAACADSLAEQGYEIVMIPMQPPSDTRISEDIVRLMKHPAKVINEGKTPKEMIATIAEMDFIIGMRLHSLIFSTMAKVPMIGLAYESKITSFLKLVKQPCAGNVETMTLEDLQGTVDEFIKNKVTYQSNVLEHNRMLREKSTQNVLLVKSFLTEGDFLQ